MAKRTLQSLADRLMALDDAINKRNIAITPEETHEYVNSMKNKNTVAKTKSDMKRVKDWLFTNGEERELFEIAPNELNMLLAQMFLGLRTLKGTEYEPSTLECIQASVMRHLHEHEYPHNIKADPLFKHSRDVLSSKKKGLKQQGKGNKKNRADPFTDEEMTILYEKSLLGDGKYIYIHVL